MSPRLPASVSLLAQTWWNVGACCGILAGTSHACAQESGVRAALNDVIQAEHRYDPEIRQQALKDAEAAAGVVKLAPMLVNESKLESLLDRFLEAKRLAREATKPSFTYGATTQRTLAGRPVTIGPQPYQDLLADEARFDAAKKVTPTWTLLDLNF